MRCDSVSQMTSEFIPSLSFFFQPCGSVMNLITSHMTSHCFNSLIYIFNLNFSSHKPYTDRLEQINETVPCSLSVSLNHTRRHICILKHEFAYSLILYVYTKKANITQNIHMRIFILGLCN